MGYKSGNAGKIGQVYIRLVIVVDEWCFVLLGFFEEFYEICQDCVLEDERGSIYLGGFVFYRFMVVLWVVYV